MRESKLSFRKKAGFTMLGLVLVYWLAFPFIPLLNIPNKIVVVSIFAVVGEILFIFAVTLLGKEYWNKIKAWLRKRLFNRGN